MVNNFKGVEKTWSPKPLPIEPGRFHLIAIGINEYKFYPSLVTPISDAAAVCAMMETRYGFHCDDIIAIPQEEATRPRLASELRNYLPGASKELKINDFLLIWVSGHGEFDEDATDMSYFVPIEGTPNINDGSWMDYTSLFKLFSKLKAHQILLVADTCFSGGLHRQSSEKKSYFSPEYVQKKLVNRGRQILSSGGIEQVLDSGPNGHSVFASAFLKALKYNQKSALSATELWIQVLNYLDKNAAQDPEISRLKKAGCEGGEFTFFLTESDGDFDTYQSRYFSFITGSITPFTKVNSRLDFKPFIENLIHELRLKVTEAQGNQMISAVEGRLREYVMLRLAEKISKEDIGVLQSLLMITPETFDVKTFFEDKIENFDDEVLKCLGEFRTIFKSEQRPEAKGSVGGIFKSTDKIDKSILNFFKKS